LTVLVFNQPYAYRLPVFDRVAQYIDFTVIYLSRSEPNRKWGESTINHPHIFLTDRTIPYGTEYFLHVNPEITGALKRLNPNTLIVYGFGPTEQVTYLWGKLHGRRVVVMADCWELTERNRTRRQRLIHRVMIRHANACLAAGHKSRNYLRDRGGKNIIICPIATDNDAFKPSFDKPFDLIYVAQFIDRKCPQFIVDLMGLLQDKNILIIGEGPRGEVLRTIRNATFLGGLPYSEMAHWIPKARICLMPTLEDHWGLVANEAHASGVPVLTTLQAGCADDLVWHELTGYILPLVPYRWAYHIRQLLDNPALLAKLGDLARQSVEPYSFENAANAIIKTIKRVTQ